MLLFACVATFAYTIVAALLEPLGLKFRYFTDWSPAHFTIDLLRHASHHVGFILTAWFLVAYAGAVVVAEALVRSTRFGRLQLPVLAVLAACLYFLGLRVFAPLYTQEEWLWNWVSQVCVGGSFMLAGYVVVRSGLLERVTTSVAVIAATYFAFWYIARITESRGMGMVFSDYPMGLWRTAVLAGLGILGVLQLAALLDRLPSAGFLDQIGKASKQVMIHHLFVFTLINLAFAAIDWMPLAEITGVYVKHNLPVTWPIYLGLGVLVPWLGYEAFLTARRRLAPRLFRGRDAAVSAPSSPAAASHSASPAP
jgi:hypothetical protein